MKPSTRFVVPIAALALACGAVVWPRWLQPRRVDPCAHPDVLAVTGLIPGSRPAGERRDQLSAENIQWSEGLVLDESLPRDPMVFRMVRTFNVLKAAERPLGLMPARVEPETARVELVDAAGGPLPVHLVRSSGSTMFQVVAYSFVYGNEPVTHPFVAQVEGALRELRNGRRPLTILLVGGAATPDTAARREELALRWIASAWQHYRGMCLAGGRARSPESSGAVTLEP
jgi:hypothetical protein